jgi:hypothetical protein
MELTLSKDEVTVRFKQGLTIEEQKAVVESKPATTLLFGPDGLLYCSKERQK